MKQIFSIILSILVFSCMCFACSKQDSTPIQESLVEPTALPTEKPTPEPVSWKVYETVDEFGDPSGKEVKGLFIGSFENNTTGQSGEAAMILYYIAGRFLIQICENSTSPKTFNRYDSPTCAFKIDNDKYRATLIPHNRILFLVEQWYGEKIPGNEGIPGKLIKAINENKKIPFIINLGNTSYEFQVDGSGYKEAMKTLKGN